MLDLRRSGFGRNTPQTEISCDEAKPTGIDQPSVLTAIPAGQKWRMKALASNGEVSVLPAVFRNSLEALGACLLLANQCGAEVRL